MSAQSGTKPVWNELMSLSCDEEALLRGTVGITVELYADGTLEDKLVGTVRVPVSDIAKSRVPLESPLQYHTFQVFRPSGRAQGLLNLGIGFGKRMVGNHVSAETQTHAARKSYRSAAVGAAVGVGLAVIGGALLKSGSTSGKASAVNEESDSEELREAQRITRQMQRETELAMVSVVATQTRAMCNISVQGAQDILELTSGYRCPYSCYDHRCGRRCYH